MYDTVEHRLEYAWASAMTGIRRRATVGPWIRWRRGASKIWNDHLIATKWDF